MCAGSCVRISRGGYLSRAKLYWADGRVEIRDDVDPKASRLQILGPDGRSHTFRATEEIEDGCDVYREETDSD